MLESKEKLSQEAFLENLSATERASLRIKKETKGRARETLEKFRHLADRNSPLDLNALNEIIVSGSSLAQKECFPEGIELNAAQAQAVREAVNEIERVINETTVRLPLENENEVSLKAKLEKSVQDLNSIGKEILAKIPVGFQNSQNEFIQGDKNRLRPNALYIIEELRTMQTDSFRSLGDVNLVTLRAEVLLEDKSYPRVNVGYEKLYCPTAEQKECIREIIKNLLQSAKDAKEKANDKIVHDVGLQVHVRKKLASLIRIGQEVMSNTQNKIKKDSQTMVAS